MSCTRTFRRLEEMTAEGYRWRVRYDRATSLGLADRVSFLVPTPSPRLDLTTLDLDVPHFVSPIPAIVVTADRSANVNGPVLLHKPLNFDQLANAIGLLLEKP